MQCSAGELSIKTSAIRAYVELQCTEVVVACRGLMKNPMSVMSSDFLCSLTSGRVAAQFGTAFVQNSFAV